MTTDEFFDKLTTYLDDKLRDFSDLLRQEFRGELKRSQDQLSQEILQAKQEVISAVTDIVGGGVLPQIDGHDKTLENHEVRILHVEEKVK